MVGGEDARRWVAGVFDRAAPSYDRVGDSYHDAFGARLAEVAGIAAGAEVLDVACGRGAVLLPARVRAGAGGRVVGVDLSAGMVRAARAELHRRGAVAGADDVALAVMDAQRLGFDDDCFDAVTCSFSIPFFPDPEGAVAELRRVLRPGGVLAVSAWGDDDERWSWQDGLLAHVRVARRAVVRPFDAEGDLERLLAGAGLLDVAVHVERLEIAFSSEAEWWDWMWSYSIRGVLEQLSDREREEFRHAAFAEMQALRTPAGFPMTLTARLALGRKR